MAANVTKIETPRHFMPPNGRLYHPFIKYSWGEKYLKSDQDLLAPTINLQGREEHVERYYRDVISKIHKVDKPPLSARNKLQRKKEKEDQNRQIRVFQQQDY